MLDLTRGGQTFCMEEHIGKMLQTRAAYLIANYEI